MSAPYLVLAGPTAVGKSEVALEVAERLGGEIVAADSRQVYRGLDVGTAKPTAEERARAPHHMIDVVEIGRPYSAADYAAEAGAVLDRLREAGRVPVVCGGTGFYLEALAEGLDDVAPDAGPAEHEAARRQVAAIAPERRYEELRRLDPESAERLHPNDSQRVGRALEVWFLTGEPIGVRWGGPRASRPHLAVRLHRPRVELRERIEARLERMLERGLEREARALHDAGHTPADPGVDTIGYQEWWPHFEGRESREDAIGRIRTATRRYAKRQETWFRRRGRYRPVAATEGAEAVLDLWSKSSEGIR